MAEQDAVGRAGGGEVPDQGQGRLQGRRVGQVEAGEREAGGRGVDVCVGERRGDKTAVQVDHLVDAVGERVGGALGANPGDLAALHDHRGREGIGGTVDFAAAEQDGRRFGGALTHGEQSRASPAPPRTQVGQMRGGRASYGVDSTTVVRVETPARPRSLASSSSSSCGVATRTLRM